MYKNYCQADHCHSHIYVGYIYVQNLPLSNKCTVGLSVWPKYGIVGSKRSVVVVIWRVVVTVVGGAGVVGGDVARKTKIRKCYMYQRVLIVRDTLKVANDT